MAKRPPDPCQALRDEVRRLGREMESTAAILRAFAGTRPLDPRGTPRPLSEDDVSRMKQLQTQLSGLQHAFDQAMADLVECLREHGQVENP
jgi:hypothetical protein